MKRDTLPYVFKSPNTWDHFSRFSILSLWICRFAAKLVYRINELSRCTVSNLRFYLKIVKCRELKVSSRYRRPAWILFYTTENIFVMEKLIWIWWIQKKPWAVPSTVCVSLPIICTTCNIYLNFKIIQPQFCWKN